MKLYTVAILGAILVGECLSLVLSRTNALIHDSIAGTVAVDMASQMIFDSQEAMLAYKKSLHAEHVSQNKD